MSRYRVGSLLAVVAILSILASGGAWAKSPAPGSTSPGEVHPTLGPATIKLGQDVATLKLPEGFAFLGKDDTARILKENGNFPSGTEIGLIVAKSEKYFIVVEWEELGYVKDDEAGKIDADAILKSYQEGTEANNEKRKGMGEPEMHVTGWAETPRYDAKTHQVVWGLVGKSGDHETVNYFTRMLGRRGVLSLNLVTGKQELEANKKRIAALLGGTSYVAGQRYEDYQAGKDKESEMGLTGLILAGGGVAAAAKLGLLAKAGKLIVGLLLVGKKFVVFIVMGLLALFSRLKGGGSKEAAEVPSDPSPGQ